MAQGQRRAVDLDSFWTVPHKDYPTWQIQVFPYDFGGANPGPDVMPAEDLAEAARQVILEEINLIAKYPPTHGPVRTREVIAEKMRRHRGITWAGVDDILVTNGSAQGILLGVETMTRPGDVIVTDRFFYQGAVRTFRNSGLQMVTVDRDDQGMRMDLLEEALRGVKQQGKRVKFIYTIPSPQNPDGTIMPMDRRERMLALAQEYDTLIMEDDCYVDQALDVDTMPPAIASLDGAQDRVIYIATFSKIISPGTRVAWVAGARPIVDRFAAYKQDVGNDYLSGLIVAKYLEDHMDDRIEYLNQRMRQKRDTMLAALGENFGPLVTVRRPEGGMFLWARFPDGTDMKAMETTALEERGVRFLAGYQFSPTGDGETMIRLNYSFPTLQEINDGIGALAQVMRKHRALPE